MRRYTVDIPGPAQRIVVDGQVANEGSLKVPYFCDPKLAPFVLRQASGLTGVGSSTTLVPP